MIHIDISGTCASGKTKTMIALIDSLPVGTKVAVVKPVGESFHSIADRFVETGLYPKLNITPLESLPHEDDVFEYVFTETTVHRSPQ